MLVVNLLYTNYIPEVTLISICQQKLDGASHHNIQFDYLIFPLINNNIMAPN